MLIELTKRGIYGFANHKTCRETRRNIIRPSSRIRSDTSRFEMVEKSDLVRAGLTSRNGSIEAHSSRGKIADGGKRMAIICPGCNLSVEPIRLFDKSPKTGKPYLLTRCPRERCGFFIDIQDYTGKFVPPEKKNVEKDELPKKSYWRYGL